MQNMIARCSAFALVLLFAMARTPVHSAESKFLRGDSNGDLRLDIGDPIHSLQYAFTGGSAPKCVDAGGL